MLWKFRSNRLELFCKKGVLKNFPKFTGKHLCQSLFFNKVAGLTPVTLFIKRLWTQVFSCEFAKFLRTPFLVEHLWWLLLGSCFKVEFFQYSNRSVKDSWKGKRRCIHSVVSKRIIHKKKEIRLLLNC